MALSRTNRLRASAEVAAAIRRGRLVSNELAIVRYSMRSPGRVSRFVFVVPKKAVKRSTLRNKIRRRAAEWVRSNRAITMTGHDIVVIFRKPSAEMTRGSFYRLLEELFEKAKLLP